MLLRFCRSLCSVVFDRNTIFAVSSGHGKCGVSVLRISGPATRDTLLALTVNNRVPNPRVAHLTTFHDPQTREPIDRGLLLWFPGPHSFTGEDVAELHVHGSTAVLAAMLTTLGGLPGLRHAEAGEFTKRAFYNGKFDLTEVEGLADLIHSETEAQRKQALRQMEGALSTLYKRWSNVLLKCVANIEAVIDFGEDENIEDGVIEGVGDEVEVVLKELRDHLSDGRRGERLRSGLHVAILGAPNAGKSSLLNIMCQKPKAIVSPHAGTTRDVVESTLDIGGYPVILSDTAGLRSTQDPVEQEGVRRALTQADSADLKIVVVDSSEISDWSSLRGHHTSLLVRQLLPLNESNPVSMLKHEFTTKDTIIVMNKTDLLGPDYQSNKLLLSQPNICWISCTEGDGIKDFLHSLQGYLSNMCGIPGSGGPSLTQAHHRQHLTDCQAALEQFTNHIEREEDVVFCAEALRMALRSIGHITGKLGVEDILDVVFRDFCIGK